MYMTGSPSITFDMGPMLARAGIMAIFISPLLDGDFTLTGCSFEKLSFDDDCNLVTEKPSVCWSRANMRMTVVTIILIHIIVLLTFSSLTIDAAAKFFWLWMVQMERRCWWSVDLVMGRYDATKS